MFGRHFNKISKELDYDLRLIDLCEEKYGFFDSGAYAVQSPKMISYSLGSKIKENLINIRVPIEINLNKTDPKLSEMLNVIESSYNKIQITDFSDSVIWLK